LGRDRHRHSGAVVSASDVAVVWWCSGGGGREEDSKVHTPGSDIQLYPDSSRNPLASEQRWTPVPQRLRKVYHPSLQ